MSENTHMPGPWTANLEGARGTHAGGFSVETTLDGHGVVVICGRAGWPTRATESHANAHLIAAAPELYEALKDCCAALGGLKANPDAIPESARLALAKAEGR